MILITGSNSILGKKVASRLIAGGKKLKGLDEYEPHAPSPGFETLNGTVLDRNLLKKACEGVETVIHLMDRRKMGYVKRGYVKNMNVTGVKNLILAARTAGVKKIVFMSSYEVYGNQKKFPIGEDVKPRPTTPFGKDKLKAERLFTDIMNKDTMDITIVRPAFVVGPGTEDPTILITMFMALAMEEDNRLYMAGDGDNRFQMIDPDDLADAVVKIVNTPASRGKIYNIGSDNVPTQIDQTVKLKERAGLNCAIKHISPGFARFLSALFRPMKINYLTREHVRFLTTTMVLDCQRAKTDLDWYPTRDNHAILAETIEWYKKEKL